MVLFFATLTSLRHAFFATRPEIAEVQPSNATDVFDEVLTKPFSNLVSIDLAPGADFIATISGKQGYVSLIDVNKKGAILWSKKVNGARAVTVSKGGHVVLVYAPYSATNRLITILNGHDGSTLGTVVVDGPIWSLTVGPDGAFAAAVTGNHSLYMMSLASSLMYKRWDLYGIGSSVAFSLNDISVFAGTWDRSGVSCYSRSGNLIWTYPTFTDPSHQFINRIFEAYPSDARQSLLAVSYSNAHHGDGTLYYWRSDQTSRPTWAHYLGPDTYLGRAEVSANGQYVAVTYTQAVSRKQETVNEHRILLLDSDNNQIYDRGGLLFTPTLVSIAPDGHRVTVSDGQRTLYHLNGSGRISARWPSPDQAQSTGVIRYAIATTDGRFLLVYTGDGTMHLLRTTH